MRRKKNFLKPIFFLSLNRDEGCVSAFEYEYEWAKNDLIKIKMQNTHNAQTHEK